MTNSWLGFRHSVPESHCRSHMDLPAVNLVCVLIQSYVSGTSDTLSGQSGSWVHSVMVIGSIQVISPSSRGDCGEDGLRVGMSTSDM